MVAGLLAPSQGQIVTEHGALTPTHSGPARAKKLGIALVTQEPAFAADLSVADNLFMGRHPAGRLNFLYPSVARRQSADVVAQLGLRARPEDRMGDLPLETQQLLAFGRAVFIEKARTILLDEITASLTSERKESLLGLLRRLIVDQPDLSFTLISHHVSEVLGFAGLEGSGKDAAIEAFYGLVPNYSGSVVMDGAEVHLKSPKPAQTAGISFLPKHREEQAVIQNRSVLERSSPAFRC